MIRSLLALLAIVVLAGPASAEWQRYHDDGSITASFDIASFAQFQGKPSVWVRWHYDSPRDGIGGMKLQFTAECDQDELYEIDVIPYDADGNYLAEDRHYDAPKEYPVTPDSLNEATLAILCH